MEHFEHAVNMIGLFATMEMEIARLQQAIARNVVITTFTNVLSYIMPAQCDISPTTSYSEIVADVFFAIKRTRVSTDFLPYIPSISNMVCKILRVLVFTAAGVRKVHSVMWCVNLRYCWQ